MVNIWNAHNDYEKDRKNDHQGSQKCPKCGVVLAFNETYTKLHCPECDAKEQS